MERRQLPAFPSRCFAIHKSQGAALNAAAINSSEENGANSFGMEYAALPRAQRLQDFHAMHGEPRPQIHRNEAIEKALRQRESMRFPKRRALLDHALSKLLALAPAERQTPARAYIEKIAREA